MTKYQLRQEAASFRDAIVRAKRDRAFGRRDRMNEFPRGCCDDIADLFTHYLYHKYGVDSIRVDGDYYDGNFDNNCSHSWQEVGKSIVDITGDQFKYDPVFLNYDKSVYVGPMDDFHSLFDIKRAEYSCGIENLNIDSWDRMYELYNTILSYME